MKQQPPERGAYPPDDERYYRRDESHSGPARRPSPEEAAEAASHYLTDWPAYNDAADLLQAERTRAPSQPASPSASQPGGPGREPPWSAPLRPSAPSTGYYAHPVGTEFRSGHELAGPFRGKGPKGYVRSDERIKEDLCECLCAEPTIDASEIVVECVDGVVILSGFVEERWMKHRVEDMADACSGVKDVRNELSVSRKGRG